MLSPASAALPASKILGFSSFAGPGGAVTPTVPSPLVASSLSSPMTASMIPAPLIANTVPSPLIADTIRSPLIANTTPAPLMANLPALRLKAVQKPLLAGGKDAGRGSAILPAVGGYTLPGVLVVIATVMVAIVGAGNVRVWQARIAARRAA